MFWLHLWGQGGNISYSSTLIMERGDFSKTVLNFYQNARRHIWEYSNIYIENLKIIHTFIFISLSIFRTMFRVVDLHKVVLCKNSFFKIVISL